MSEKDRQNVPLGSDSQDKSSHETIEAQLGLGDEALTRLQFLRLRLSQIQRVADSRARTLAMECESVLDEISKELQSMAVQQEKKPR